MLSQDNETHTNKEDEMRTLLAIAMIIVMAASVTTARPIKRIEGSKKPLTLAKPYGYKAPARSAAPAITADTIAARRAFLRSKVSTTYTAWAAAKKELATFEAHVSIMNGAE